MNNHNMLFYSLRDPSSNEILSKISSLPFKVLKIPVEKYSNKIPAFVRQVPTLKLQDGNIIVGPKVLEWCNIFVRGSAQQQNQYQNQQQQKQTNPQGNVVNDHGDVSAVFSKELTGFSDSYSFLTDVTDEKKVEKIKPIGHAYSFLDNNVSNQLGMSLDNLTPQNTSSSGTDKYKTNKSNGLDDALERMQQERMKDMKGSQRF